MKTALVSSLLLVLPVLVPFLELSADEAIDRELLELRAILSH